MPENARKESTQRSNRLACDAWSLPDVKVDAWSTIVAAMVVVMAPPVAMTPAAAMNFDDIGRFGSVDDGGLTGKRTCSLRNGE
jgi:hypothetical protein